MNFSGSMETLRIFWTHRFYAYRDDIKRLYDASRGTAASVLFFGVLSGVVPLGVLVALFRLTDALIGSRSVRVATTDLQHTLWTVCLLFLIFFATTFGREQLQGVAGRIFHTTERLVLPASLLGCIFLFFPFGAVLLAAIFFIADARSEYRAVRVWSIVLAFLTGAFGMVRLVHIILSRDVTVGGFLLFSGALSWFVTWFVLRRIVTSPAHIPRKRIPFLGHPREGGDPA